MVDILLFIRLRSHWETSSDYGTKSAGTGRIAATRSAGLPIGGAGSGVNERCAD